MTDIFWYHYPEEDFPDGCCPLEVQYKDGSIACVCSCDLHWGKYYGKDMPEWFRVAEDDWWKEWI